MNLDNIIIMKCGTHASEKIEDIFNRKKLEEINNDYTCWGYGGTLCHPINQVQLFCKFYNKIYLLLTPTNSELNNDPKRAEYLQGRVDKACAIKNINDKNNRRKIKIIMIAELVSPYSIFVK